MQAPCDYILTYHHYLPDHTNRCHHYLPGHNTNRCDHCVTDPFHGWLQQSSRVNLCPRIIVFVNVFRIAFIMSLSFLWFLSLSLSLFLYLSLLLLSCCRKAVSLPPHLCHCHCHCLYHVFVFVIVVVLLQESGRVDSSPCIGATTKTLL